jgi:2-oxoglutarate ferredoxin oxidoreductase subunit delta
MVSISSLFNNQKVVAYPPIKLLFHFSRAWYHTKRMFYTSVIYHGKGKHMVNKRLIINEKWCKGCGICVAFCPKQVLVLKKGKVTKANPDACIKCGQCEQRCPDYAIYLEKVEEGAN